MSEFEKGGVDERWLLGDVENTEMSKNEELTAVRIKHGAQ
jgi:hypothetical protein